IAMLTGERAFVLPYHGRSLLGDSPHFPRAIAPHVEDGTNMQRAYRRMRIPSSSCTVPLKHFCKAAAVFSQVLQWHSTIFDEGHRLAIPAHAHHDLQAGLSHIP